MTTFFTIGYVRGCENNLRSEHPWTTVCINTTGCAIPQGSRISVTIPDDSELALAMYERFCIALQSKGFLVVPTEQASYILHIRYKVFERDVQDASLSVVLTDIEGRYPPIWEGHINCYRSRFTTCNKAKTLYGKFEYLDMDIFIGSLINHFGKQISCEKLDVHPREFRCLSQRT